MRYDVNLSMPFSVTYQCAQCLWSTIVICRRTYQFWFNLIGYCFVLLHAKNIIYCISMIALLKEHPLLLKISVFHSLHLLYDSQTWSQHVHHDQVESIVHRCCTLTAFYMLWAYMLSRRSGCYQEATWGPAESSTQLWLCSSSQTAAPKVRNDWSGVTLPEDHLVMPSYKKKKMYIYVYISRCEALNQNCITAYLVVVTVCLWEP